MQNKGTYQHCFPMWEKGEFSYGLHRSIQRTYHVILSTPFAKLSYAMPLSTLLCIVAVIEQFRFHSGPHALAAGVIMASATCMVHALLYAILPDYVQGVLASPITVDNCPMNARICLRRVFQYPRT